MNASDKAHLVDGKYGIGDLVNLDELRRIFERFTEATGFTIGFLDHPGLNILISSGWRDICTKFHRACPVCADNCATSNRRLLDQLDEPGKLVIEQCENGLVDCAFPIIVKGKHIASLATGQLLIENPDLERFKRQARVFGFDEHEYLRALGEVPVIPEGKLRSVTTFLGEMALVLSQLGYAHLTAREEAERLEKEIAVRKEAEEALRESEERYAALFRGAAEGILVADVETKGFVYANPAICRMLGYSEEEMTSLSVRDIHPAESLQYVLRDFEGQASGEKPGARDLPCRRKDGSIIYADITASGMILNKKRCSVGFFSEVTERKRAEAERQRLEAQLRQAQKMESVGRLAGGVAHDFNNMLGVILGHTEMALDQVDPSQPLHGDLKEILKAAQYSADLTRKLLAFGRKQTIAPQVLDLNETVAGMLKMLQRLIGEDIDLVWRPDADLWRVRVDPSQVDQILANLCVNARDAISGVGRMTIETGNSTLDEEYCAAHAGFVPGEYVMLAVSDDGCGMDKETLSHLFEPFFTTKETGKGTGLGLATVYGIVKQNDGFINVYSEPGKGTTLKIYLPRHVGKAEVPRTDGAARTVLHGHETILLVEDEAAILRMTATMLKRQGYTVLAASTPGEAMGLAREHAGEIHLLMTDVVMPEMNGRDLAKKLLALHPQLKRLFMSGYTANVIAHHGVLDEGVHFIQKPFAIQDLTAQVRKALEEP